MSQTLLGREVHLRRLAEIPEPPTHLSERGEWPSAEHKLLVVVGSRAVSTYGREACESLIESLRGYPVSIVSGLALGTDAIAHRAALKAGLHTIAVPGSGLGDTVLYPRSHAGLAHDIVRAGGLLLSEHEDGYRARAYDFPSRNRIMVGLSHAVLVIEAAPQSGTLITARLTHEYNRDLLCVPHRINDPHGHGPHQFIRLGATLVTEGAHILEMLGMEAKPREQPSRMLSTKSERAVYDCLQIPRTQDEVLRLVHEPPSQTLATLISLELQGVIEQRYGTWKRKL